MAVIHDENMNGKLIPIGWGIPTEGYGFQMTQKVWWARLILCRQLPIRRSECRHDDELRITRALVVRMPEIFYSARLLGRRH